MVSTDAIIGAKPPSSMHLRLDVNGHVRDQNGAVCQWSLLCVKHVSPGRLQSSPFLCRFFSFLSFFLLRISLYSWAFPSDSWTDSLRDRITSAGQKTARFDHDIRRCPRLTPASAEGAAHARARFCLLSCLSPLRPSGLTSQPVPLVLPPLKDKKQLLRIGAGCPRCFLVQVDRYV